MHRRTRSLAVAIASASFLAFGIAACSDAEAALDPDLSLSAVAGADFSGSWTLNKEASDLPARDTHEGEDQGRPPRPPRPGDKDLERPEGPNHGGKHPGPMHTMTIGHIDSGITVADGPHTRTIFTDGRTETITLPDGSAVEITAGWDDATLVIRRSMEQGPSAVERWMLNDAGQLVISATADGPEGERTVTFVYDPVE